MGEVIYGDIKRYIDELAQSLGVAAEHVYELLVRQQYIEGILWLTIQLFVLVVLILLGVYLINFHKKAEWRTEEIRWTWGAVEIRKHPVNGYARFIDDGGIKFIVIAVAVVTFVTLLLIPGSINHLINPEYYAIKEIMNVFSGGR